MTLPLEDVRLDEQQSADTPWQTVVWNDPVNLMSYVSFVFQDYFGYSREEAERLMMQVHTEGRAVVSKGSREKAEADTIAMHGYSLWATYEQEG
mgnify:CR=1 FL=1